MRKTHLILAGIALGIGTAAVAEIGIEIRMVDLQRQVDAGKRSGKLSLGERVRLANEIKATKRLAREYGRSGGRFTRAEHRVVQDRLDNIQVQISGAKRNGVRGPNDVPF